MNISKISRSLVVIIFVALILFIGYNDILLLLNNSSNNITLNILKVVYIIIVILLVTLYIYIKDKLYRKKIKRNISLVYRYIYISFIVIVMSIISIYSRLYLISNITLIIYIILKLSIGLILKKIIFNVSKSDILSVLGLFAFSMLPYIYINIESLFINLINTLVVFLATLLIQILIDELKQRGIKNKKYLMISTFLGVVIGFSIVLGISIHLWALVGVISLILTVNLDKTHIGFPKKIISFVNQKTKDTLYKMERINISKLLVSIILIAVIACIISGITNIIIVNLNITNNLLIKLFNINSNFTFDFDGLINNLINNTTILLSTSKTYYFLILIYIVFIEFLALALHRRYDTKSTVMKLIFILLYLSIAMFNLDITNYQTILTVFLILIAIVNTSNIYLNREERVKLLVA